MQGRAVAAISIAIILGGCSYAGVISRESREYNGTVEDATNILTITNVLRAKERLPLYFAALSAIRGALTQAESFSLPVPFGPGKIATGKHFTITLAGSVTNAPGFDIATLDTQAFTSGILNPIPLAVAQFYWDRNDYPKWLLANLFISKIEVERKCPLGSKEASRQPQSDPLSDPRPTCNRPLQEVLENNPDDPEKQFRFEQFLYGWLKPTSSDPLLQAYFHSYSKEEEQGPVFRTVRLQDIVGLGGKPASAGASAASGGALRLKQVSGGYQLVSSSQAITICPPHQQGAYLQLGGTKINAPSPGTAAFESQKANKCLDKTGSAVSGSKAKKATPAIPRTAADAEVNVTIYQRSPLQMFGYLGAIVRKTPTPQTLGFCGPGNP